MRIRSTKPEFWRSKRIAQVDWDTRLVLKGLESYVDDNGVGRDDIALIVTDIFPRDFTLEPSRVLKRVQVALDALKTAGLVWRYEAYGTDLLFVSFWEQIQYINRPSKGRLPRPDGTLEYGDSEIGSSLLSPQEDDLSPQSLNREQGTGDQVISLSPDTATPARADDRFDEFWDTYSKKVGRKAAQQKYRLALKKKGVTSDVLIAAAGKYIAGQKVDGKHPEFTKDPTTWLNGEHWNDQPPTRQAAAAHASTSWMDNT